MKRMIISLLISVEIHATPLSPHSIKLSWERHNIGEGDEVQYAVYYQISGGGERFEMITDRNNVTLRELQDNTLYRLVVVPMWKFRSVTGKRKEIRGTPSTEIECKTFEKGTIVCSLSSGTRDVRKHIRDA